MNTFKQVQNCKENTTRYIFCIFDSSLIGSFKGWMCEECTAKYGTAVNFENCPFCGRKIIEWVR